MHRETDTRLLFWVALTVVVLGDVGTKAVAQAVLAPAHVPRRVLGDTVRLTFLYNPGAAFGFHLGPHSRWIFFALSVGALVVLWRMYRANAAGQATRVLALGLVSGGALGNVINRLWSARGVIDFIDVGMGDLRWPAFNVADAAISVGAVLLAWTLWLEDRTRGAGRADAGAGGRRQ